MNDIAHDEILDALRANDYARLDATERCSQVVERRGVQGGDGFE